MGNSDDDRNGDQSARNSNDAEDLFTRTNTNRHLDNHFTSLFSTLWSLPSTIYQRGNEHGREFNRLFDEQRKEREEEQEREDGRGSSACGWRGRRRCHDRQERDVDVKDQEEKDTETVMDDWVNKVVRELERGEKEAQELYNEWWRKMEGEGAGEKERKQLPIFEQAFGSMKGSEPSDAKPDWKGRQQEKAKAKEDNAWAEIFPAWSSKTAPAPEDETKPHEHVFGREQRDRPLTSAARDVEDTIDKLHQDFERWMGATSQWGQFFQNGYMRDSRLWEDEGLFGPSMPFSRPLSTIFSLGMRPFLPQDSAMAYLLYSEYSPLHLEHEKGFDASFRRRFEDLVRVQSGKEMLKDDEEKEKVGTKVEWIGRIVPLLKEGDGTLKGSITIGSTGDRQDVVQIEEGDRIPTPTPAAPMPERSPPDVQADEGPGAELDMYEQHFGDLPRAGVDHPAPTTTPSQPQTRPSLPSHSSILSTLTTTERQVGPDGTVTTKTVLKKRFADGREESSETVETSPASWATQHKLQTPSHEDQESKIVKEVKGGKGWFWSS